MQILLIRHGDPDYANDTLTQKGHAEARALAERLRDKRIDELYVSPLGRARATARYAAHVLGKTPTMLDWLCELNGNYDGSHWAWNVHGTEVLNGTEVPSHHNWTEVTVYGRHMAPVHAALVEAFDGLIARHGYEREGFLYRVERSNQKTLAFFCHAGVCYSLISHLLDWPLPLVYVHLDYATTGLTRITWDEKDGYATPRAMVVNDTSHLRNLE